MKKEMTPARHGLLWFGAAVSLAEIVTGAALAPLGVWRAFGAIALGHALGGAAMYFAGIIGARSGRSAMECAAAAFGARGGGFFSVLNIVQLAGWTAVMFSAGSAALRSVWPGAAPHMFFVSVLGLSVALWIFVERGGDGAAGRAVRLVTMLAMFALCALATLLALDEFFDAARHRCGWGGSAFNGTGKMSFAEGVELSAVMPLSWLPLISDYTRDARNRPARTTLAGVLAYSLTSCWMYALGVMLNMVENGRGLADSLDAGGFGAAAVVIVIASTVTTAFLDVFSAGVSASCVSRKIPERAAALAVCAAGMALAALRPDTANFEVFLYFIGSVFAPMAGVVIADFFLFRGGAGARAVRFRSFAAWAAGFAAYRFLLAEGFGTPLGISAPVVVFTAFVHGAFESTARRVRRAAGKA